MISSNSVSQQQLTAPLLDALQACAQRQHAPFYAPGHKRGQGTSIALRNLLGTQVLQADLPELPDLDNLFAPQAVIQQAQELAAETFEADRTWFLINGSSSGLIAAILATCATGDKIILPRNVHQSVISGLLLSGAVPIFVQPEYNSVLDIAHSITAKTVAAALTEHPDAKTVLMLSPTYYGVCGDVEAIAQLAHQHGIPLLVDEAHGAHFAFHPDLPTPALAAGADLVVQSTHKVLSSLTQSAMLHIRGQRIEVDRLCQALQLVQSTSPSYLLLASLDAARQQMATQGKALMERTLRLADTARSQISQISNLSVLSPAQAGSPGFMALDRTRLTVTVSGLGIDGFTADEILHQQLGVTAEFPSLQHLTFIISLGNTEADIQQLVQAFKTLVQRIQGSDRRTAKFSIMPQVSPLAISPRDAFFAVSESVPILESIDRISAELICPYPPGIPVLMPGEKITGAAIGVLQQVLAAGGMISGCADSSLQALRVIRTT